jgi:hypothetical protein
MLSYGMRPDNASIRTETLWRGEAQAITGITESSDQLVFHLDAVLTPEHAAYHSPRPGEQYCYEKGSLVFPDVTRVVWLKRGSSHYTDASGDEDLGNIDILTVDGNAFVAEGDWGAVRISGAQPRFELSAWFQPPREKQVDSRYRFLSTAHADLLNEILTRRSPTLLERIRQATFVSRSDAEEIMSVISDEVINNLDDDWEPTEYGQAVSAVLAQFNAVRVNEWP